MPVTFHLIHNAQGFHNLSRDHESIQDPGLTPLGEQQCKALKEEFPYHGELTRFVASPLRRTLSTCLLAFAPSSDTPIIALPELKEVGDSPCDTGSDPQALQDEFGQLLDIGQVTAGWNCVAEWISWQVKLGHLQQRAARARRALHQLGQGLGENDHVAVVCHGAFLHFLTDDYVGVEPNSATAWKNTEFRSYRFSGHEMGEQSLVETQESWTRRNGVAPRINHRDQPALADFYYRQLEPFLVPRR